MQRVKIPQLQTLRENAANTQWIRNESVGKVVHSWKFAVEIQLKFFDATIGSKNYTICKIHLSLTDIFPTDWVENSQSAIAPSAKTGSEWSEINGKISL